VLILFILSQHNTTSWWSVTLDKCTPGGRIVGAPVRCVVYCDYVSLFMCTHGGVIVMVYIVLYTAGV